MYKIIIITLLVLLLPKDLFAYNVTDYNPDYTPYNLGSAISKKLCRDKVTSFDSDYQTISDNYYKILTVGGGLKSGANAELNNAITWFETNKLFYSNEFKICISEDDEYEEKKAKEEAKARYEAKHQADILEAIETCDMDFLDNLQTEEKMATYDERLACKAKISSNQSSPLPVVQSVAPAIINPVTQTSPVTYDVSQVNSSNLPKINYTEDESETIVATSSDSTNDENIEITQEEMDRLIEQKVQEALENNTQEPVQEKENISIFKRIVNFFKSWF